MNNNLNPSYSQLQGYLRYSAAQGRDVVTAPPFTCYFDPNTDFKYFNYAIPDESLGGNLESALDALRATFRARGRLPRFEFIRQYAPNLAPSLRKAGFVEEGEYAFMLCTPESLLTPPSVPGLSIQRLMSHSSREDAIAFSTVQGKSFDPDSTGGMSEADAERFLQTVGSSGSFLVRIDGEPTAAGSYTIPYDGLTELVGIGTLPAFRRRGIAAALTAHMAQTAFNEGVTAAFLTAGDELAGRTYTRAGFYPYATSYAFSDPEPS